MYNNLSLIQKGNNHYISSLDVAKLIDKRHDHLLRDIDGYVEILDKSDAPNFGGINFFLKSTYIDKLNRKKPCYLLSKSGCEICANKLTGEKGVLFTAAYVSKFNEMEEILQEERKEELSKMSPLNFMKLMKHHFAKVPLTFTASQFAQILGMYSMYGNPHTMAVSCILNEILFIDDEHKIAVSENYETGIISTYRYDEHAFDELSNWLFIVV